MKVKVIDGNSVEEVLMDGHKRWWSLVVVCLGTLMINLDSTIVNVALPSIRVDLGFSEASLVWVVNAYLLTFGGFLLLGGRLGDLFGHRRMFLLGITLFTLASLGCGLAGSQGLLVGARAMQGIGGALVSAAALSLTMTLFAEPAERAKATGIFAAVITGGGSLGLVFGGTLTNMINWHWIFLVNLPIGAVVYALGVVLLADGRGRTSIGRLDVGGAVTVTMSLMLAVYAIVKSNEAGWVSAQTLISLLGAASLLALFVGIEARASAPLMPLRLFRLRNLAVANVAGVLWSTALLGWFFNSALYLQFVLRYTPLQVGLTFLPANLLAGALSLGVSAKLVIRFGIKPPLTTGLLLAAVGLLLFGRVSVSGNLGVDVFPAMFLLALGSGIASAPLLLAAMSGVPPGESGAASGLVNTTFTMGGAFGLAVLASAAAARTKELLAAGTDLPNALNSGYHVAFLIGAGLAAVAALLSAALLHAKEEAPVRHNEASAAVNG